MDSSISSDNNMKEAVVVDENEGEGIEESADVDVVVDEAEPSSLQSPARSPDVPQPQPPPSPFQRQFEHFVVSQSFSLEGGEQRGDQEGEEVNTEDEEGGEGGRLLSDEEDVPGEAGKEAISQAFDLNISSGRLTPEVEEINFELSSQRLSEQESEQKEKLGNDKATKEEKIKDMCDEITLDVVDSIVTDAHEGERLAGLQRQDTEASFCESDALSSEVRLSEGEVLLPKEGSASEGEVTLGGNSGDRPRIREPGVAEYFGDVSASEGEANVVQRSSEGGSQQFSSARGRAVPVGLGQQQQRQHQQQQQRQHQQQQRQSSARRVR